MERGVHLERQGLRADESARAEVPESPSAESQAAPRQGRLPGNQSCHTQVEGRDLLIKAVLSSAFEHRHNSYYSRLRPVVNRTTDRDVTCHTLMEGSLVKAVL